MSCDVAALPFQVHANYGSIIIMQKLEGVHKIEQVIVSYRPSTYLSLLSPHYNTLLLFITISLSIIVLLPLTPLKKNSIDQKYILTSLLYKER